MRDGFGGDDIVMVDWHPRKCQNVAGRTAVKRIAGKKVKF